ncbi:MAG: carboxypeptidase regulatory-like domain-containing protein [Armatimonadetes bacterium]|nr:carboxypeptidase regulatory-like domain-containing protein [Armatimonadota bacterium]
MRFRSTRRWTLGVLAALLGTLAWGCGGSDAPANNQQNQANNPPPPTTRTVSGFVGDATTGNGINGALVAVGNGSAQTGPTGNFTLPGVPRVDNQVAVSATGYATANSTLAAGVDQINVRLIPAGAGGIEPPPGPVSR